MGASLATEFKELSVDASFVLDCPTLTLNDGLASVEDGLVMVEKSTLELNAMPNGPPDRLELIIPE